MYTYYIPLHRDPLIILNAAKRKLHRRPFDFFNKDFFKRVCWYCQEEIGGGGSNEYFKQARNQPVRMEDKAQNITTTQVLFLV